MAAEPADCAVSARNGLGLDRVRLSSRSTPPPPPPPDDGQILTTTRVPTAVTTRSVSGGSTWSHAVTALPRVPVSTDTGDQPRVRTSSALSESQAKPDYPQSRPKSSRVKDHDGDSGAASTDMPSSNASVAKRGWSNKQHRTVSNEGQRGAVAVTEFQGLSLNLDGDSEFAEEFKNVDMIKFSNRGSMMINGQLVRKLANTSTQPPPPPPPPLQTMPQQQQQQQQQQQSQEQQEQKSGLDALSAVSTTASTTPTQPPRPSSEQRSVSRSKVRLTQEEEGEKVRALYALGTDAISDKFGSRWPDGLGVKTDASSMTSASLRASTIEINDLGDGKLNSDRSPRSLLFQREEHELAGGIEDWADVDSALVDRYGFILPKQDTISTNGATEQRGFSRISAGLQLASEKPRKKSTSRRSLRRSTSNGTRSSAADAMGANSALSPPRPRSSPAEGGRQGTMVGVLNKHLDFRSRDQKAVDHAGDMLTLPNTMRRSNGTARSTSEDPRARRKEIQREEKWRKMARPIAIRADGTGGGMAFEFDTTNPKLIERTWKGVPDKWRATAWHAFLSASAKKHPDSLSDEELVRLFEEYQKTASPHDVQIDMDVPRTISSHIMFRRRYRGGQRLLFHVLHAMSLHFSETGYVQGMAALAATLLAYYEEEKAFVMLVRLWELRGLDKLYKNEFAGLLAALDDFEKAWLCDGELANKLSSLNIFPTAYGTRWYLTLLNYSIPFPAQLRVWDVFMLLGDDDEDSSISASAVSASAPPSTEGEQGQGNGQTKSEDEVRFGTTLDVLHAASAALIDGMRDILMDSEFDDCMTVLTSWIPIKDEDVFMRVVKAEWTAHRGRMKR